MFTVLVSIAALAGPYEEGLAALKAKDYERSRDLFLQAVADDPTSSDAHWELGWAYWTLDDFEATLGAWKTVEALDPAKDELQHWVAAARARLTYQSVAPSTAPVEQTADGRRFRFAAAGDTMMGSDLKGGALPPDDGVGLFAEVRDLFRGADVAFLNLEGPLADGIGSEKCRRDSTACYAFRTPTRFKRALVDAGIDVVSLANNHAWDLKAPGMLATMAALDSVGIAHAGRYGDTATLAVDGLRVGVVATHSGGCCLNVNDIEEVQRAVALLDRDHDVVVLSFHGGAEGAGARHLVDGTEVAWGEKRGDLKKLARAAVDGGADLVIGHGPHVLRGMEVYRGRLVAYSLGNFLGFRQFGGQGGYGAASVILDLELAGNGVLVSGRLHPLLLDGDAVPHRDAKATALDHIRELTAADLPEHGVTVAADGTLSW